MTIEEQIMKLQTYKMYEGEDTVYVERDDVLKALEQEPCEDWISRQDTIDTIYKKHIGGKDAIENAQINDLYACGLEEAVDAVENMPSVTPQQTRWIPVSERMPDDGQDVLFCNIDEDVMKGYHIKGRPNTYFTQQGTCDEIKYVTAWMECPESYKIESEE